MVATPHRTHELADDFHPHAFLTLTAGDAALLHNLFALSRNIFALAQHQNAPLTDCLAWLAQPHIAAARDLIASELAEGLKSEALEILRHIARTSPDPIEQRRAATQVLRVLTARAPTPRPPRNDDPAHSPSARSPLGELSVHRTEGALSSTPSSPSTSSSPSSSPSSPSSVELPPPSPAEESLTRAERLYAELLNAGYTAPTDVDADEDALIDEDDDLDDQDNDLGFEAEPARSPMGELSSQRTDGALASTPSSPTTSSSPAASAAAAEFPQPSPAEEPDPTLSITRPEEWPQRAADDPTKPQFSPAHPHTGSPAHPHPPPSPAH